MRATIPTRPIVSRASQRAVPDAPLIRRYTSPCGVSFEAPQDVVVDRGPSACGRCGSREWDIDERPWGDA